MDFIEDEKTEDPLDGLIRKDLAATIEKRARLLLKKEEWEVVSLRYGLGGEGTKSITVIAEELGLLLSQAFTLSGNAHVKLRRDEKLSRLLQEYAQE